jgi:hypothetical protein
MANSLTNILDKILARGLMTLREAAVMPRLVNVDFSTDAAQKGNTIDVPKPVAQTVSDVTPGPTRASSANTTPGLVQIPLDQWRQTNFFLSDKEMVEVDRNRHFIPMQTSEAARALANDLDTKIHEKYVGIYGYVGTAGVIPFSTVKTATDARKVLNEQLAPMNDRRVVIDPTAESQALQLSAYSDVEKTDDRAVKIEGEIGRKFGMDHFMSQNVVTHTAGTVPNGLVFSTTAAGVSAIDLMGNSTLGTLVTGDIFTIAGDTQTYVVQATVTIVSTPGATVAFGPALAQIASANSAWVKKSTHVVNLAFQRNAFAYATRPLAQSVTGLQGGNIMRVLQDDLTGLVLRLEVVRESKQDSWEFDVLHGEELVRPEFAARIAG